MNEKKERFMGTHKSNAVAGALMLLIAGNGGIALKGSATQAQAANAEKQMTTPSKFYCNAKALTSEERAHHKTTVGEVAGGEEGHRGDGEGIRVSVPSAGCHAGGIGGLGSGREQVLPVF